ncbi:MAG: ubiquinone/menaquinone biosynthesis methyltransferase [Desulfobacteraceae bacterium]|nr:MAG: ubiquinone/menaquinone biosynthesis methyltransferase [Desulfobacteraceae bacterium]
MEISQEPGGALVSYGYRKIPRSEKRRLLREHFDRIAGRYDLADTLLSCGLHFHWRKIAMDRLFNNSDASTRGSKLPAANCGESSTSRGVSLYFDSLAYTAVGGGECARYSRFRFLDLCGGTGDFAILAANKYAPRGLTLVCDLNSAMMHAGKIRASRTFRGKSILWVQGDAEKLGFPDCSFDAMTVGYGIRNLVNLENGLREMFRVLKKKGKLVIMEFSLPVSSWLRYIYDLYSFKVMPRLGRLITGESDPFLYLAESVRTFHSPEKVADVMSGVGFRRVEVERLTNGLVSIYVAEKI